MRGRQVTQNCWDRALQKWRIVTFRNLYSFSVSETFFFFFALLQQFLSKEFRSSQVLFSLYHFLCSRLRWFLTHIVLQFYSSRFQSLRFRVLSYFSSFILWNFNFHFFPREFGCIAFFFWVLCLLIAQKAFLIFFLCALFSMNLIWFRFDFVVLQRWLSWRKCCI